MRVFLLFEEVETFRSRIQGLPRLRRAAVVACMLLSYWAAMSLIIMLTAMAIGIVRAPDAPPLSWLVTCAVLAPVSYWAAHLFARPLRPPELARDGEPLVGRGVGPHRESAQSANLDGHGAEAESA